MKIILLDSPAPGAQKSPTIFGENWAKHIKDLHLEKRTLLQYVNGTPLQYSCLENPMDGGACRLQSMGSQRESDTTEWLHFHFSHSCIGEGNGNPLQCSCLENPRDGGAWWAAVYGVAQSRTQLKRLNISSSGRQGQNEKVKSLSKYIHKFWQENVDPQGRYQWLGALRHAIGFLEK